MRPNERVANTMRWAQLTLTETDPGSFDPDFWLKYFTDARCDGAVIGSGGYMAFYPTEIPFHYRSSTLGDSDAFGYLVERCRRRGMAVLCRTDAHAVHADAYTAHPEWIAVTENHEFRPHWAMPGSWVTCALGEYTFSFMNSVHREIMEKYAPDGIFCNRWSGSGICYCAACRAQFRSYAGIDVPSSADRDADAMVVYYAWRERRLFELCEHWDTTIQSVVPGARFIPNSGGGVTSELDMVTLGEYSDILFIDRQSRHGTMPLWANGRNGKELRSVMRRKPIGGIFSTGIEEEFRWKDSVQSEVELRIWVAEAVANGMRPWFTKFCGRVYDDRWMPVVASMYRQYADWEEHLRLRDPVADAAIVVSQKTARRYARSAARELVDAPIAGFYQALIEDRTLFEIVHADTLSADRLAPFRVVILPNVAILSDENCAVLREFVRNGGGLVATLETSLYDESGKRRDDFLLSDLFGVHAAGPIEGPIRNSYIRVNHDSEMDVSLIHRGLESAGRMINAVRRVPVAPIAGTRQTEPFSYVPPYPDLPMEEVYPRESDDDRPEVFFREVGAGRVVYFCGDIDRRYEQFLTPDHGRLLANSVLWAMRGRRTVEAAGSGYLDVTCWDEDSKYSIHVVNMTNPYAMRGAAREVFPVDGITIRIRTRAGVRGDARALAASRTIDWRRDGEWIVFELPRVDVHELIVFELDGELGGE